MNENMSTGSQPSSGFGQIKTAGIILALIVLVAIIWFVAGNKKKQVSISTPVPTATSTPTASTEPVKVQKTNVPISQTPQGFPADVPIEKGATITQNYNATSDTGLFQATRVFTSSKSAEANFALYSSYFKTSGWAVTITLDTATEKLIAGKKGNQNLKVSISQNTVTKEVSVDITYSSQK
jgi:hypothetical protein